MKLTVGQLAPKFEAVSMSGSTVSIDSCRGKFTILSFHRYVGCPLCNMAVRTFAVKAPQVLKAGLAVINIFESNDENLKSAVNIWGSIEFPVIADPKAKIFGMYGVDTSLLGEIRGLALRGPMVIASARAGINSIKRDGAFLRMPASFFIGPDLKIFDVHYGKDTGDHLTPALTEKWLRIAATTIAA